MVEDMVSKIQSPAPRGNLGYAMASLHRPRPSRPAGVRSAPARSPLFRAFPIAGSLDRVAAENTVKVQRLQIAVGGRNSSIETISFFAGRLLHDRLAPLLCRFTGD